MTSSRSRLHDDGELSGSFGKVVHDRSGCGGPDMTTVHATTATQKTVDGREEGLRGDVAPAYNIIP